MVWRSDDSLCLWFLETEAKCRASLSSRVSLCTHRRLQTTSMWHHTHNLDLTTHNWYLHVTACSDQTFALLWILGDFGLIVKIHWQWFNLWTFKMLQLTQLSSPTGSVVCCYNYHPPPPAKHQDVPSKQTAIICLLPLMFVFHSDVKDRRRFSPSHCSCICPSCSASSATSQSAPPPCVFAVGRRVVWDEKMLWWEPEWLKTLKVWFV